MTRFVSTFVLAGTFGLAVAIGCSSTDSVSPGQSGNPIATNASGKTGSGSDSSGTPAPAPTPSGPLSNGPVASLTVTPHAATVTAGNYLSLIAAPRDAKGQLVGRKAQWRSSNTSVAVVSDTGLVYGKAAGTATVYASVDSLTDSARVTVLAGPTPVSQFDLTVVVAGVVGGADTLDVAAVPGATVTLTQFATSGDTLTPGPVVGSAITDATGTVHFTSVAGGAYTIHVTPASGSPYQEATVGLSPPLDRLVTRSVFLQRKP